ncbi:MAG: hypothetical protein ACM31D_10645 [Bacteroidota bacterium]
MSTPGHSCANCVFWSPRDGQSSGRCRAKLLEMLDPRLDALTQATFVCGQWCGRAGAATAAE